MKRQLVYFAISVCFGLLAACQTETDIMLAEEGDVATNGSLLINGVDTGIESLRGIRPLTPSSTQDTATDENKGEKGRDRRDGSVLFSDKFDAEAPIARLNVLSVNDSGDYVIKLVFGLNYRQEEIEYAFEGRTLKICLIDEADQIVESFIIDNYHIGDKFVLPGESFNSCTKIELLVGYFLGEAFWYVGDQSYEAIFD